jgi:hypothetical protein
MKDKIPKRFRNGQSYYDENCIAYDVGGLKDLLKELPDDLEIHQGFAYGVALAVRMNVGTEEYELEFCEPEKEEEDDDDA